MDPILMVVILVIVLHLIWTWWCCKKASDAYRAAEILFAWANAVQDPLMCAVAGTNCEPGAGPGWPPDSPGDFPPSAEE